MELIAKFLTTLKYKFAFATLIVNILFITQTGSEDKVANTEHKLLDYLLNPQYYNPQTRPVKNPWDVVNVKVDFFLQQIVSLDTKSQVLSVFGWYEANWNDPRMTWDSDDYGGLEEIAVKAERLWLPRIVSEGTVSQLYNKDFYEMFEAVVYDSGHVSHWPGGTITIFCEIEIFFFPFDRQLCRIEFSSWVLKSSKMRLYVGGKAINLKAYKKHDEWTLLATGAKNGSSTDEQGSSDTYSNVQFFILLQRKPLYYIVNLLFPAIMLTILGLLIFAVPPESGEKLSLGVTLLVSISVYILVVADKIPSTSRSVPVIIVYLTFVIGMSTLSLVLSVVILRIYHHDPCRPAELLLRVCRFISKTIGPKVIFSPVQSRTNKIQDNAAVNENVATIGDDLRQIKSSIQSLRKAVDEAPDYAKDWMNISKCLDRLFLVIYVAVNVILILYCWVIHPLGYPDKIAIDNGVPHNEKAD